MWKWDMVHIPVSLPTLRLQGFTWLGRLFSETKPPFGAKLVVAGFDQLGRAVAVLALAESSTSAMQVLTWDTGRPSYTVKSGNTGQFLA